MLSMIFDSVLILCLLAGAVGGWRLHKKILALQMLHQDFQKALRAFDDTSRQTSETLILFEAKAKEAQALIETSLLKTDPVRQDLLFLCQRAEALADNLMQVQAPAEKKFSSPSPLPFSAPKTARAPSHAERELADLMAQKQG